MSRRRIEREVVPALLAPQLDRHDAVVASAPSRTGCHGRRAHQKRESPNEPTSPSRTDRHGMLLCPHLGSLERKRIRKPLASSRNPDKENRIFGRWGGMMRAAMKRKGGSFPIRVCRYCGKKTRGPAHFRHEQACGPQPRGRAPARRRRRVTISQRSRVVGDAGTVGRFFERLRRLVQQEIQRQLRLTR